MQRRVVGHGRGRAYCFRQRGGVFCFDDATDVLSCAGKAFAMFGDGRNAMPDKVEGDQ